MMDTLHIYYTALSMFTQKAYLHTATFVFPPLVKSKCEQCKIYHFDHKLNKPNCNQCIEKTR